MRPRARSLSSGQRRTRVASAHNAAQTPGCSEAASTCAHWRGPQASCRSRQQHVKPRPTTPHLQKLWCSLVAVAGCRERMQQAELESADDGRPLSTTRIPHTPCSVSTCARRSAKWARRIKLAAIPLANTTSQYQVR